MIFILLAFPSISFIHPFLPHSCYMPYPSHSPWLYHSRYTWKRVQVMKLIMQLSSTSCHFISLRFRTMISHQRPLSIIYDFLSLTNSTLYCCLILINPSIKNVYPFRCHLIHIRLPVLPLHLPYVLRFLPPLP
jgi:hypothetical protein